MVFDANAYEATVRDYHRQGDMTALEGYLTQEIARLRESGTICAGVACTCGKDADALAEEDAAYSIIESRASLPLSPIWQISIVPPALGTSAWRRTRSFVSA